MKLLSCPSNLEHGFTFSIEVVLYCVRCSSCRTCFVLSSAVYNVIFLLSFNEAVLCFILLNTVFCRVSTDSTHAGNNSTTTSYFTVLFSERELMFRFAICYRRSVCRLSVCL